MARKPLPTQTRFNVLSRDRFTCRYCSRSAPDVELHVDHVKPVSKGGTDDLDNLVASCNECNLGKSNSTIDYCPPAASGAKASGRLHPMRGMAFLSFRGGELLEQGVITDVVETAGQHYAIVLYFEWIAGCPTYGHMIPLSNFAINDEPKDGERTYRLFSSNAERNDYYEWKNGEFKNGSV